jgi:hypothetical protein
MKSQSIKSMMKYALLAVGVATLMTACSKDDDKNGEDNNLVLDGYYIKGSGTALESLVSKGRMTTTKNEVVQEVRSQLYEMYIAIEANGSFNIVSVLGAETKTWGPGSDFALVPADDRDVDEPKDGLLMKGSLAETETAFTVSKSALYHVVFDTELKKVAVAEVKWGIIGAATPGGWGESTEMTAKAFNKEKMEFEITDVTMLANEFKFRYSSGWKIILDEEYDLGGGDKGIKVNANFGGTVAAIEAGGANMTIASKGKYTLNLTWELGKGTTATVTKTADIENINWTGAVLDAVGSGVSADNTSATADGSSWGWGNVMVADNEGKPVVSGDLFTWVWTGIILEQGEGFKLRTINGVSAPETGVGFDVGYGVVDADASSSKVADVDGNLSVTEKGPYTITLTIDSNTDTYKIVIVEI